MGLLGDLFGFSPKGGTPGTSDPNAGTPQGTSAPNASASVQNTPVIAPQPEQTPSQANIPDYSTYSKDDLLNCLFNENDWENMKNPQREKLLQAVSADYAKEHGVSVPTVTLDPTMQKDELGGYCGGKITLNPTGLSNPYEALDTVIHETNHHVQAQNVASHSGNTEDNLALFACEQTRNGYGNGKGDLDDKRYYALQALETDSNNAGFAYLAENYDRFKSDPKYWEYLKGREQHFGDMKTLYESDPEKWKQMEIDHINNSGLDPDTRSRAIQAIQNGPDETKQKAFENAEIARNLREQCEEFQTSKPEVDRVRQSAKESNQRSQFLIDNPKATAPQLEQQYLENQNKLNEVNGKLGVIDSRMAAKMDAMGQMHRENDGKRPDGWQFCDDETGRKYSALAAEYRDLQDKKEALTNSRNILEADNENLNGMYKERLPNEPSLDEKYKDRMEALGKGSTVNQGAQNDTKQADGMQQGNGQQELSGAANDGQRLNSILATPEEASQKAEGQNISNDGHEPVAKSSNEPKQDENENLNGIREQNPSAEKHGTTNDQSISNDGHEPVAKSSNEPKQDENENLNGIREQDPSTEKHGTTNDQNISNGGHEPVAKSSNEPKQNENENLNGIREQNPSAEKHGMTNDQSNGIHEPVTDTPNNAKTNEASNGIQDTPKNTPTQSAAEKDNGISGSDTGRSNGADKSVNMTE